MATMEKPDGSNANADAAHREAVQYWGYLIKKDKCGTEKFDRLLKGIATVISTQFEPYDSTDLTPSQLAAFYRAVGGDYDVLFVETPPSSISFIYRSLGAFHSLQPAPDDDGYSTPSIPALKVKGFVTWQTIQLLLGPEQHVPFLQMAVEKFDIKDPVTGDIFPKVLPKECFPDRPDDAMEQWYESVAERLKREAEKEAVGKKESTRVRVEIDDPEIRTSSDASDPERRGAATYFSDPLYRKTRTRPGYMRHFTKQSSYVEDRGGVVGRVRHMLNPFHRDRRRGSPSRYSDDEFADEGATPTGTAPPSYPAPHPHRYPVVNHKRPHPPRREGSLPTTDSDSDRDPPPSRRKSPPILRQRRSHEPPMSPREQFPPYYDERERRYSHDITPEPRKEDGPPPPLYGPTKAPLFATQVAQIQAHNYYERRPQGSPSRPPYRAHNVRFTTSPEADPHYGRERDRHEYSGHSSRHRERPRRRSDEHPRERDRDRTDTGRTRSHDRVKDEWDPRDSPRDRDRDRDMERERDGRVRARYVSSAGVHDGVGGRRYPVEQPWR